MVNPVMIKSQLHGHQMAHTDHSSTLIAYHFLHALQLMHPQSSCKTHFLVCLHWRTHQATYLFVHIKSLTLSLCNALNRNSMIQA